MADHLSSQKQLLESSRNVRTLSVMEDQIDSYMEREFTFLFERAREPGINLLLFTFTPLFIAIFLRDSISRSLQHLKSSRLERRGERSITARSKVEEIAEAGNRTNGGNEPRCECG